MFFLLATNFEVHNKLLNIIIYDKLCFLFSCLANINIYVIVISDVWMRFCI